MTGSCLSYLGNNPCFFLFMDSAQFMGSEKGCRFRDYIRKTLQYTCRLGTGSVICGLFFLLNYMEVGYVIIIYLDFIVISR